MDGALVVITLVSLGTTGAVLLYAMRLIRDDRARSNARVAALAAEIARGTRRPADDAAPGGQPLAPVARSSVRPIHAPTVAETAAPAPPAASRPPTAAARRRVESTDLARTSRVGSMFESQVEPSANRWLIPVIGAAIVALALATIYVASGGHATGGGQTATPAALPKDLPLELAALEHARTADTLTVSGTVRNPAAGSERRQVAAVVFLFDRAGSFVASGRAPLDYQALAPGDESPFVITVPGAGNAVRYRVSFRTGTDVLPHVDKREAAAAPSQVRAVRRP
jgi:hypothetical protein